MESVEERKERLRAMRERAAAATDDNPPSAAAAPAEEEEEEENTTGVVLKFRNYNVRDQKQIPHKTIAPAQPPKYEEPKVEEVRVERAAQDEVLQVVAEGKRANWDLKRDLEKSLNKLEKRTQRALVELAQQEQLTSTQVEN